MLDKGIPPAEAAALSGLAPERMEWLLQAIEFGKSKEGPFHETSPRELMRQELLDRLSTCMREIFCFGYDPHEVADQIGLMIDAIVGDVRNS